MVNPSLPRLIPPFAFALIMFGGRPFVTPAAAEVSQDHLPEFVEVRTGVIFSKIASAQNDVCELDKCWTPSIYQVAQLEVGLKKFLSTSKVDGTGEILKHLSTYKRKYFGFAKKGTRFILINGICKEFWKPESVHFSSPKRPSTDMGNCYFLIDYNLKTGKFSDLYIDGDA